jgi:ammonia channel protein AmtB
MIDFAGGVAVHVNAGAATLAAILVLGYRNQMSGDPKNPPRFEKVADGKWKGWSHKKSCPFFDVCCFCLEK